MNVLITGTSKGIGLALAKQFALNNNQVICISKSGLLDENLKKNKQVHILNCNYTQNEGLYVIIDYLKTNGIIIDILINNAAQLINKFFEENTLQDAQQIFNTNVFAPYFLIQQLEKNNLMQNPSNIYNISSMGGYQGSAKFNGLSLYSMSKAAIANMTEVLAEELKDKNISSNAFALGAVNTEMLQDAFPGYNASINAQEMANFIYNFCVNNKQIINGKIIPLAFSTP